MRYIGCLFALLLGVQSCTPKMGFDLQGHRGCRGIMPENTLEAFQKAQEIGVNTLELDLAISADNKVVVSHEPYFSHLISIAPNGEPISEETEKTHNLYEMDYATIKQYDVGSKTHVNFTDQQKFKAYKPLLEDVIEQSERIAKRQNRPIQYNIEIKRVPEMDLVFHPSADAFAELVLEVIDKKGIKNRCTIQSFDAETLEIVRKQSKNMRLAFLIANRDTPSENLAKLSFTPEILSPYFKMVTPEMMALCQSKKVKVIPWTVNEKVEVKPLIELGVSGIITDYPKQIKDELKALKVKGF